MRVRILAQAIETAGSLNKDAIRDQLRKIELKDSLLPGQVVKFGRQRPDPAPFVIMQTKPGSKVDIVYPKDAATGEP